MQTIFTANGGPDTRYPVLAGQDPASALVALWQPTWHQAAILGDSNTAPLFGPPLAAALRPRCDQLLQLSFPAGERQKTRETKQLLEDQLIAAGFDRQCCLVAVGGGVVLDLVGFIAATLLRGVAHVNVATSLLAQVDAAVGGKTAVNTPQGKNLVGACHHPRAVLLDLGALRSLPPVERRCGLAEAVKHAVIADARLFDEIAAWAASPAAGDLIPPEPVIGRCVQIKGEVVAADPTEADRRQVLNFGHTAGHALETASAHRIPHGEAVAVGMVIEACLAQQRCGFPAAQRRALVALLARLGLPTRPPIPFDRRVADLLRRDKKTQDSVVHCALPREIGTMEPAGGRWAVAVEPDEMARAWRAAMRELE